MTKVQSSPVSVEKKSWKCCSYLYLPTMSMVFYYPVTRDESLPLDPVDPGI